MSPSTSQPHAVEHVAIIGGGFSGTLLAINLLRHDGPRATLIERAPTAGLGVAYGAAHPTHLLNVRAANMSAFPDEPDHFVRWLARRGEGAGADAFVSRTIYGTYLTDLLADARRRAGERLAVVQGDAVDLADDEEVRVVLADGEEVQADAAVLAVGNLPPHAPPGVSPDTLPPDRYVADPWDPRLADGLADADEVLILGSGLTMVDTALLLDARGFRGKITALSRRGLMPRRHAPSAAPWDKRRERPVGDLSALVREVRQRGTEIGWREAVDELRPFTQPLWSRADEAGRARFLRHLRPWWDVHRHRLAPAVADRVAALVASGRLEVVAGRIVDVANRATGVEISWRPRGAEETRVLPVRRVVNCTGPQGDVCRSEEPLLRALRAGGRLRADPAHLGLDVDPSGHLIGADGVAQPRLFAVGPMTRGAHWEIVAVPDIRRQTWDVARKLANAHWVGGEGL